LDGESKLDPTAPDKIERLIAGFRKGDKSSADELMELLYPELRRLAASKMRGERAGHTWQPTLLVNELYLALVKVHALERGGSASAEREKAAFLGLAGKMMKRLLIDHSRPLHRKAEKVEFRDDSPSPHQSAESLQFVEELLTRISDIDPKFRTVIEMRVFEGLSMDEIARQMGCSPRTVATYWAFAKRWLEKELAK
jgi:RNA polymerase sigma factor (TIGR02999 family)